jgi:D-3-phosphoglycerate dehydrogenase
VNIATFALGRREANRGADAVSLVRLDGAVQDSVVSEILQVKAITEAKLLRFAE